MGLDHHGLKELRGGLLPLPSGPCHKVSPERFHIVLATPSLHDLHN